MLQIKIFTNEQGLQYAVLTNTPWSVLLVFLLLYVACAIFFGFMISGFFSKGKLSTDDSYTNRDPCPYLSFSNVGIPLFLHAIHE